MMTADEIKKLHNSYGNDIAGTIDIRPFGTTVVQPKVATKYAFMIDNAIDGISYSFGFDTCDEMLDFIKNRYFVMGGEIKPDVIVGGMT